MRERPPVVRMVMCGRSFEVIDGAGRRDQGQPQIGGDQEDGDESGGTSHSRASASCCINRTDAGASHSRGPTARPTTAPLRSMMTVVGRARTI